MYHERQSAGWLLRYAVGSSHGRMVDGAVLGKKCGATGRTKKPKHEKRRYRNDLPRNVPRATQIWDRRRFASGLAQLKYS